MPTVNTSAALIKLMKKPLKTADIDTLLQEGVKANHASEYTRSLTILKKLYTFLQDKNAMDTQKAYCAYYIGLNFKAINEYSQAYYYLREATGLASTQDGLVDLRQVARLYMGICEEALGLYQSAIANLNEMAKKTGNNNNIEKDILHFRARLHTARCMIMLNQNTTANAQLKDIESTLKHIPAGTTTNQTGEVKELWALMYQLLGISEVFAKNFESGRGALDKASQLYKLINGSDKHLATVNQYLGVAHANLNASSKSNACLSDALRYFSMTGDTASQYFTYLALTINYANQKIPNSARENLEKAYAVLEKCGDDNRSIALELHSSTQYFLPQLISVQAGQEFEKLRVSIINTIDSLKRNSSSPKSSSLGSHSSRSGSVSYTFFSESDLSSDSDSDSDSDIDEPKPLTSETDLKAESANPRDESNDSKTELRY